MTEFLNRVRAILALAALLVATPAAAPAGRASDWEGTLDAARGQTVYFNAWGGAPQVNAYIDWVAAEVRDRFGFELVHVKLADTSDAVARVLAEKAAGNEDAGTIDLIWINGENFAAMKREGLLFGPFTDRLPNYALVDVEGKPTVTTDFTTPVDGLESPWGMAQFVFLHDRSVTPDPPRSIAALLDWAKANPGRFTYPQPPDYLGLTFLKQVLLELSPDPAALREPPADAAAFEAAAAPLLAWLGELHPHLWRSGTVFPKSGPDMRQLLDDREIDIAVSFDPLEAEMAIRQGLLPDTARVFTLDGGTIGNTHFVAIPFNARAKEAAMVTADFLLSPEAQARKQDPAHWGNYTVLDLDALDAADRALFESIEGGPAVPRAGELAPVILEPHPAWMEAIERAWLETFAN